MLQSHAKPHLLHLSKVSDESHRKEVGRIGAEKEFPETNCISLQDLLAVLKYSSEPGWCCSLAEC